MTVQEAIHCMKFVTEEEVCEECPIYGETGTDHCFADAHRLAIETLEKQIPKKVLYMEQGYGTPWLCPECEADQIKVEFFREDGYEPKDKHSYCWKCGQKLDWSGDI